MIGENANRVTDATGRFEVRGSGVAVEIRGRPQNKGGWPIEVWPDGEQKRAVVLDGPSGLQWKKPFRKLVVNATPGGAAPGDRWRVTLYDNADDYRRALHPATSARGRLVSVGEVLELGSLDRTLIEGLSDGDSIWFWGADGLYAGGATTGQAGWLSGSAVWDLGGAKRVNLTLIAPAPTGSGILKLGLLCANQPGLGAVQVPAPDGSSGFEVTANQTANLLTMGLGAALSDPTVVTLTWTNGTLTRNGQLITPATWPYVIPYLRAGDSNTPAWEAGDISLSLWAEW